MKTRIIAVGILFSCLSLCSLFTFNSNLKKHDFDAIAVDESTLDDVLVVDDRTMNSTNMLSWGAVSYHRINNGMYMVIYYYHNETCNNIVQSKQIVFNKEDANPMLHGVSFWRYYLVESSKLMFLIVGIFTSIVIIRAGSEKKTYKSNS